MNIHFLLTKDFFRGGGIETYSREVGRRLVERGHEVTVYSTRGDDACPNEWEGMRFIWLPRVKPYWAEKTCGGVFAAMRALREETPDVFHLHSVVAGSMAPILRSKGIPCILQMHGIEWQRSRWGIAARSLLKVMEHASLSAADAITAVSKTQCEYFQTCYGVECEFIPTAADIKEYASPNLISSMGLRSREYVLFAARLVPEKGAHHLIRAYRRLTTDRPLIIAGEAPAAGGYWEQLRNLAAGDSRIRFVGRAQGRLLEELFSNAALFVQPSELEGLSIGLIEAMSYGIRCLSSDIPANREVVGDAGLLFRNKDVDDLERTLHAALSNDTAGYRLASAARQRVERLFSWKRVVDQLEALYERVVYGLERQTRVA
ncbi:MAG: glycosyltransferase family 4 protein [Acidobacteriaceae bacterium]|nr:glycosyltransferase family 4 protein [Acidobacteriaceae bacterium]MBV9501336.1 glycosyltransferase family 4 protein [Acidobacteriaceae bacterium]